MTRKYNRHNFSVYFYYIYLNFEEVSILQSVLAFVPQISLVVISGVKFYRDLPFSCFMQTFWFVVFNKVCTAQYFVWYFSLLPLILARNGFLKKWKEFALLWGVWLLCELSWNLAAFWLEHKGENDFGMIWASSLAFFAINVLVGKRILEEQNIEDFEEITEGKNEKNEVFKKKKR